MDSNTNFTTLLFELNKNIALNETNKAAYRRGTHLGLYPYHMTPFSTLTFTVFQIHISAIGTTITCNELAGSLNLQMFKLAIKDSPSTLSFRSPSLPSFSKGKESYPISPIIISASSCKVNYSFIVICSKLLGLNNLHSYICCLIFNYQSVDYMKTELDKYRYSFLFKALWGFSLVKPQQILIVPNRCYLLTCKRTKWVITAGDGHSIPRRTTWAMDEGLSLDNLAFVMLSNSVNDFLTSFKPLHPAIGQTILFKLPCLSFWSNQNGSQHCSTHCSCSAQLHRSQNIMDLHNGWLNWK